jgi:hypothetical protein
MYNSHPGLCDRRTEEKSEWILSWEKSPRELEGTESTTAKIFFEWDALAFIELLVIAYIYIYKHEIAFIAVSLNAVLCL